MIGTYNSYDDYWLVSASGDEFTHDWVTHWCALPDIPQIGE
jgi:hypothetical protein